MGLCCCHCFSYGSLHLVHRPHYLLAVRSVPPVQNLADICYGRTQFRREANKADNKAASVAVDSLINFEAVKVWDFSDQTRPSR